MLTTNPYYWSTVQKNNPNHSFADDRALYPSSYLKELISLTELKMYIPVYTSHYRLGSFKPCNIQFFILHWITRFLSESLVFISLTVTTGRICYRSYCGYWKEAGIPVQSMLISTTNFATIGRLLDQRYSDWIESVIFLRWWKYDINSYFFFHRNSKKMSMSFGRYSVENKILRRNSTALNYILLEICVGSVSRWYETVGTARLLMKWNREHL